MDTTPLTVKGSEWADAWDLVRRLDATRGRLAADTGDAREQETHDRDHEHASIGSEPKPLDPDELARAIADIEQASVALRQADPNLQSGVQRPVVQSAGTQSVLVMIGVLWFSTVLVTAGVIYTIANLVG